LGWNKEVSCNEKWATDVYVGDITYVPLRSGAFCYLATLMDRFSRRIVGWYLEDTMNEGLVLPVLHRAVMDPPSWITG
jgi:putative transposase